MILLFVQDNLKNSLKLGLKSEAPKRVNEQVIFSELNDKQ